MVRSKIYTKKYVSKKKHTTDEAYAISVKWYKNQDILADSANRSHQPPLRHTLWDNGSIEIQRVQPEDTGEYVCEISRPEPWGVVRQRHAIEVLRKSTRKLI